MLKAINKGVTAAEMLEAGQKLVAAGFDLWAIVIMGLTGQGGDWEEHIRVHRQDDQRHEAPAPVPP